MLNLFKNHKAHLAGVGRELGLSHDGAHTLTGSRDGIDVGVRLWTTKSDDSTSYWTTVHAGHPVPLRMSLTASRQSTVGRFFRSALGSQDLPTGHAIFDEGFRVRALDPTRARALLQDPALRDAMLQVLSRRHKELTVSDTTSSITISGWNTDVEDVRAMLNSTFHVATEIARARAGVPLSDAESRAARSLKGAAERLGFQLDAPALKAQGRRGRHQQLADVSMNYHHDGAWTTEFEVRYPQPLGLGIKLLPQRGFWASVGEFFGTQDIEVGHPAFDATFKVKGQPEDRVAELLQGDVAGKILSLHAVAKELNVGDEGVHATAAGLMDDAGSLVRSLEVVSDIAEAIAHRAFGGPTAPYR